MEYGLSLLAITLSTAFVLFYFVFTTLIVPEHSSEEPPIFPSRIPYIGHILGLLQHGTIYYQKTSQKSKLPIYTLRMLNGKVYIVTSPELVAAVNRNSKSLAFNPFIAQLGMRITGHDEATSEIVQHNLNGENGTGYVIDVHDAIVSALSPGEGIENMIVPLHEEVDRYLSSLEKNNEVDMYSWIRRMVTLCSTRAMYGSTNPFSENPSLYNDLFWDFDKDLNLLIANIFPTLTCPKGNHARSTLGSAFEKYFSAYTSTTQSSAMIRARHACNEKWGVTPWNQGRLEVGTLIGVLVNTVPSTFYMLAHIFSSPTLLADIRSELETHAVSTSLTTPNTRTLHIMPTREKCALLHSTFQEMLRLYAHGASSRMVREDTWLDGRYLLRAGGVVQMPMAVMHSDPAIWGPDAAEFRPRRFLREDGGMVGAGRMGAGRSKESITAYRPFGGGASMCPGRHFVTVEIMALVAVLVLRFDFVPLRGEWVIPKQKQESLATNVFPPGKDLKVRVERRKGFEDVEWEFEVN